MAQKGRPKSTEQSHAGRKKAQIEEYLRDEGKLIAATASSVTNRRKTPAARAMQGGDVALIKRSVYQVLLSRLPVDTREKIHDTVCKKWHFCENRNEVSEIAQIVYAITIVVKPLALPVCYWVFLMKYRFLDELCNCENREIPLSVTRWLGKKNP